MKGDKVLTVRVAGTQLRRVMRARGIKRQSDLIKTLLAEEEERLDSLAALREIADAARRSDSRMTPADTERLAATNAPRWDGRPPDYDHIVWTLMPPAEPIRHEPPDAASGQP